MFGGTMPCMTNVKLIWEAGEVNKSHSDQSEMLAACFELKRRSRNESNYIYLSQPTIESALGLLRKI